MRITQKQVGYLQNELKRFFEVDVDLIDARLEGLSLQVDWHLRFDLNGKRAVVAVDKNGRFEATVSTLIDAPARCLYLNKPMTQSTDTKTVVRNAVEQQYLILNLSAAL